VRINLKINAVALAVALTVGGAYAGSPGAQWVNETPSDQVPVAGQIDTAFSPYGRSEALVLKIINTASRAVRLSAYSFTSVRVTRALLDAKSRGVDVRVVVDHRQNILGDRSGKARAVLNLLSNAGIPTRTISYYDKSHDKFIVSDAMHVQTGSFNYSAAAAQRNSENVMVVWGNPGVAASYLKHWQTLYERGRDYKSTY